MKYRVNFLNKKNMKIKDIKKIIYSSDFTRIHELQPDVLACPFKTNVTWLKKIVGIPIERSLDIHETSCFWGDELGSQSIRWKIYSRMQMPLTVDSWAEIYEDSSIFKSVASELRDTLRDALIVSFESSPGILKFYNEENIPYIDFATHPIRFLDDYIFAIRTNIETCLKVVLRNQVDEEICFEKARIYQAKASRVKVFDKIPDGSALFLGQMNEDSSLIQNRSMISQSEILNNLEMIHNNHPKLYYKKHPHNKSTQDVEKFLKSLKRAEVVDYNIYDCFGSGKFFKAYSMSSGSLTEAKYFGQEAVRLSRAKNYFDLSDYSSGYTYIPVLSFPMMKTFWDLAFSGGEEKLDQAYNPYKNAMSKSLGMSWGGRI